MNELELNELQKLTVSDIRQIFKEHKKINCKGLSNKKKSDLINMLQRIEVEKSKPIRGIVRDIIRKKPEVKKITKKFKESKKKLEEKKELEKQKAKDKLQKRLLQKKQ
jgi:hypothetical protein